MQLEAKVSYEPTHQGNCCCIPEHRIKLPPPSNSSANKKSVLFADGVAPGDGTSTSGGEDVAPLLRDRNKRMTKKKLDSKRRRARKEALSIKKVILLLKRSAERNLQLCSFCLFAGNRSTRRNHTIYRSRTGKHGSATSSRWMSTIGTAPAETQIYSKANLFPLRSPIKRYVCFAISY